MRKFALVLATLVAALALPAAAREVVTATVVEEWVATGSARLVLPARDVEAEAIAAYGPFRVLDRDRAALVDVTDAASPAQFAAMLRDYPAIATLDMVECPGTEDDRANFRLGRMVRAHRIATHVPAGGSVRSGAVELFLAGATRAIDDGAEFAVHSWMDETGREAHDYPPDSLEHRPYIAYYREMGMDETQARAFYDMTNSVSFAEAKWLDADAMRRWVDLEATRPAPAIAYLDLGTALP